jgi:hypothetical protein
MNKLNHVQRLLVTQQPYPRSAPPVSPQAFVIRIVLCAAIVGIMAEAFYLNRSPCSCTCAAVGAPH